MDKFDKDVFERVQKKEHDAYKDAVAQCMYDEYLAIDGIIGILSEDQKEFFRGM